MEFIFKEMIQTLAFKFRPKQDFFILDQTLLPERKEFLKIESPKQMALAIKDLRVRGANLIGIMAGFSLAQYAFRNPKAKDLTKQSEILKTARPTAVHLSKAVELVLKQNTPEEKLKTGYSFL